jgi:membrane-bound lytic murein transglycosylase D
MKRLCLVLVFFAMVLAGCAGNSQSVASNATNVNIEPQDSLSFAERAAMEKVSDSLAIRPSWTYYQYALQAMDNQEWLLAKHYLDESLRQLVSEKYDSTYRNVSDKEDSLYPVVVGLEGEHEGRPADNGG